MGELVKVGMADYKIGKAPDVLISYGLGSCVGIALYDPVAKIGGLLHIMLPDSKQAKSNENPAKFADLGIPKMYNELLAAGASKNRLVTKIAGGSQMFKFSSASDVMRVGERNAIAAKEALAALHLNILASDVGGSHGRTVELDLNDGVYRIRTMDKGQKEL